jgi:hypothetical protein
MDPCDPNLTPEQQAMATQQLFDEHQKEVERWKRDNARYLEDRASRLATYRDSEKTYDHWVLTLSGGLLGLSMTFLKDILGQNKLEHPRFVVASWAALGISIGCILINLRLSPVSERRHIAIMDDEFEYYYRDKDPFRRITKRFETAKMKCQFWLMESLNWLSLLALLSGISILGYFVFSNFRRD